MTALQEVVTFLMFEAFTVSVVIATCRSSKLTRRDMLDIWLETHAIVIGCFAFLFLAAQVVWAVGP